VLATWEAGVTSASIGVEEFSFWCLVEGGLAGGAWEPSINCKRFPSLLEVPDFWPGAMGEENQPIEVKEFSDKWER